MEISTHSSRTNQTVEITVIGDKDIKQAFNFPISQENYHAFGTISFRLVKKNINTTWNLKTQEDSISLLITMM